MITARDVSYRVTFQGAYELSALVNGHYETRQYFDYTKREATRLFLDWVNS